MIRSNIRKVARRHQAGGPGTLSESLEPRTLLAAAMAGDINVQPWFAIGVPDPVRAGDLVYYVSRHADTGRELWKTDGTVAGTSIVNDIYPGPLGAEPENMTALGDTLFFTADNGVHGRSLWKTDGTEAGTVLVDDLAFGPQGAMTFRHGLAGDKLVFIGPGTNVNDPTDAAIWASDGTAAGTGIVRGGLSHGFSYAPELEWVGPRNGASAGGTYFFSASTNGERRQLWKSDGTAAGTVMVKDVYPGDPQASLYHFASSGDKVYFIASEVPGWQALWVTDGTAAGTTMVLDQSQFATPTIDHLVDYNGALYFRAQDPATSEPSLFRTDGTTAGTHVIRGGFDPMDWVAASGGVLYFTTGDVLWASDGTAEGSEPVKSFNTGGNNTGRPWDLRDADGTLVLRAGDTPGSQELWRSDGTAEGTRQIADPTPTPDFGGVFGATPAPDGRVVFFAHGQDGYGLWSADCSGTGPAPLSLDRLLANAGSSPSHVVAVRGDGQRPTVLFAADDGVRGTSVYASDGTPQGTTVFMDIPFRQNPGDIAIIPFPGGRALISTSDSPGEMWVTDGTEAGSVRFPAKRQVLFPTEHQGLLYFASDDGASLWKSDGTPEGTVRVKLFNPVPYIKSMASDGERLYLGMGLALTNRPSVWTSDGTEAGTVHLVDLTAGSETLKLGAARPGLMFFVQRLSSLTTHELWRTDGTASGTAMVKSFAGEPYHLTPVGGELYFSGFDSSTHYELWKSDGTAPGTRRVTDHPSTNGDFGIDDITVVGDQLYYIRSTGLYRTNGNATGTLVPSASGERYSPTFTDHANPLTLAGNTLYFTATSTGEGVPLGEELWQTDAAGTRVFRVADINPGRNDSTPSNFAAAGDTLFFTANNPDHGPELWRARAADPAVVTGRHLFYDDSSFDVPPPNGPLAPADAQAVALDKRPLLPGGTAGPSNVSNYSKGINGVFVDFLGANGATLTADDFEFKVGAGGDPAGWVAAPAPLAVTPVARWQGAGAARYAVTSPGDAVRNQWLQVTVKANANTGLAHPDVFAFGSLTAETGDAATPLRVSALDLAGVRRELNSAARIDSAFDFNRDGRVNALDLALARASLGNSLGRPVPAPPPAAAAARVWDESQPPLL